MIDQIADEQQATATGLFADVQLTAARQFRNDVIAEFNKKYKLKIIKRAIRLGREIDLTNTVSNGTDYRGFIIELDQGDTDFVDSNLQMIYIEQVELFLSSAVNSTLKIFDLDTSTEIDSRAITGVTGWNTIQLNTTYDARRIFVAFDATNVTSVELDITRFPQRGNTTGCCWSVPNCNTYLNLRGATSTIASPFVLTEGANTFGLNGNFSVVCSWENLICNNKDAFVNAWVYLLISQLMEYLLYSRELTEATVFDRNKAQEQGMIYMAKYKGGGVTIGDNTMEFPGELNQIIDSIDINQNDVCIECNDQIRFQEGTP